MITTINNPVQNHNVWQKKTEQSKQRVESEKSQEQDSGAPQDTKDTVEIQSSSGRSIESHQETNQIRNSDEAEQTVEETIGLISSQSEKTSMDQVHDLNPGSLIDILV